MGEYLSKARVKKIPKHKNKQNRYFYVQVIKMERANCTNNFKRKNILKYYYYT